MRPRTHSIENRKANRTPDARQRGSVIILVVVVLVLMVLLGTAYLQSARFDQQAAEIQKQSSLDQVARAQLGYIQRILRDDLIHEEGGDHFFLSDHESNEPYDYPFTNTSNLTGDPNTTSVGVRDDAWLASTELTYTAPFQWPHVTNLNNSFLILPPAGSNEKQPREQEFILQTGNYPDSDTGLEIESDPGGDRDGIFNLQNVDNNWDRGLGADTDGDGIQDARWTWAEMKQVGEVKYVAAVRIVDLSSMVNLDTAMSSVEWDGNALAYDTSPQGTDAPRWWYPSEVNLGQFLAAHKISEEELEDLLEHRLGEDADVRTQTLIPWQNGTASSRFPFWLHGPRVYGEFNRTAAGTTFYQPFGLPTELELRRRNGLSSGDRQGGLLPALMPDFTRSVQTEFDFSSVGLQTYDTSWPADPTPGEFFQYEPLHLLTTMSGVSNIGPITTDEPEVPSGNSPYDPAAALRERVSRFSLNQAIADNDLFGLRNEIRHVYANLRTGTDLLPGGYDLAVPEQVNAFANQFAACIFDYIDPDNELTNIDGYYGFEALPMISEAWVQYDYLITAATDNLNDTWNVTWTEQGDGFIIEIRNPHPRSLNLENIEIVIGSDAPQDLAGLVGSSTLSAGAYLVIYKNTGSGSPQENVLQAHPELTTADTQPEFTGEWPGTAFGTETGGSDITIELRATEQGAGSPGITYQSVAVFNPANDDTYPEPIWSDPVYPSGTSPVGDDVYRYKHASTIGNGQGLNMLTVVSDDFVGQADESPGAYTNYAANDLPASHMADAIDDLGDDTASDNGADPKTDRGGPAGSIPVGQLNGYQMLIRDMDQTTPPQFWHVGELAHIAVFGPTGATTLPGYADQTIPERWQDAEARVGGTIIPDDLMLNFFTTDHRVANDGVGDTDPNYHPNLLLPPAMVLLDRLAIDNGETDGVDNDADGQTDEEDEQFEPGRINLNTAPLRVLRDAMPIPDQAVRQIVADAIENYRSNPTDRGLFRTDAERVGIASLGELMNLYSTNTFQLSAHPILEGSDTFDLGATRIDFTVPDLDSTSEGDGIIDDREELAMVMRWLAQVGAVRSDRFAVYMVIRGYPADDFRKGPVEQKRLVAILDRSTVTDSDEPVRILAVREF